MSLALLQAVLSSNHTTKSSTRLALVLLAWHACSCCGRVYVSVTRLANEMNIHPSKAKVLLHNLRDEKEIEYTGEYDPHGIPVYRLRGSSESATGEDTNRSESATGGVAKPCRFCRAEGAKTLPNKQEAYRQEKDQGQGGLLAQPSSQAFSLETTPREAPGGNDFITFNGVYGMCRRCGEQHQRGACVLPCQAGTLARLPAQEAP
jgi:hypothetical protein